MHTPETSIVFSDIHLTTAEPLNPHYPLWKRYKRADLFPDDDIAHMMASAHDEAGGPIEIILNGDIFDFDAVCDLPAEPPFPISWLERQRGLMAEEEKSAWKMGRILDDHHRLVDALRERLTSGDKIVLLIGNHDLELHWPSVQAVLQERLAPPTPESFRICPRFYLSQQDTLIEHGNQYDMFCLCMDPLSPTIRLPTTGVARIRLPFGNWANRMMLNGMGLFNPHATDSWKLSFWGYVVFFYRDVARTQPLLPFTWLWGATATFLTSLRDGLLPAETDVLHLDTHVRFVATQAQSAPRTVRAMNALRAFPAISQPWRILRELWLDRALLLSIMIFGTFQLLATIKLFVGLSNWWWLAMIAIAVPPFVFYAAGVHSEVDDLHHRMYASVPTAAKLAQVERIVFGHTHRIRHDHVQGIEVLNPGTWSSSYKDAACTEPIGQKAIVWISGEAGHRQAQLREWRDGAFHAMTDVPSEQT